VNNQLYKNEKRGTIYLICTQVSTPTSTNKLNAHAKRERLLTYSCRC